MAIKLDKVSVYTKHELTVAQAESMLDLGDGFYIAQYTVTDDIYRAVGLKSYDFALPHHWFFAYLEKHRKPPEGVWCYDHEKIFGEFVSLESALVELRHIASERLAVGAAG